MPRYSLIVCIALSLLLPSCTPGIRVRKNPTDRDKGIRYYRPKPYLFVTAAGETTGTGDKAVTKPSDMYVNIELKYLPDFSEEYSISVNPGLGVAKVNVSLADGWNLTSINQELDSQFDENLNAVGNVIKAVAPGGLTGTSGQPGGEKGAVREVVAARNIPLGFYESVIAHDNCGQGKKQIYGWRYVGFAPFNGCPLYADGANCVSCQDGSLDGSLYGLTFVDGVMVFKELHRISMLSAEETSKTKVNEKPPAKLKAEQQVTLTTKAIALITARGLPEPTNFFVLSRSTEQQVSVVIKLAQAPTSDQRDRIIETITDVVREDFNEAEVSVEVNQG